MKIPKYIKKMILDRATAQVKSNKLQDDIERWFEKHNIEVEWKDTHVGLYVEPQTTMVTYLEALQNIENKEKYNERNY